MTFEDIEAQGLEKWVEGLRKELWGKTYKPSPVRREMIPKPDGGERPLGIPSVVGKCGIHGNGSVPGICTTYDTRANISLF